MADKNWDPTDPSDPSVTPDPGSEPDETRSSDSQTHSAEPSGEDLVLSGDTSGASDPEVSDDELAPIDEDQLTDILGDDSLDLDDAEREPAHAVLGSRRPVRKSAVNAEAETTAPKRRKKQTATPKQRREDEEEPRTSPPEFVQQSVSELRKVVWPTGEQVRGYFVVVLVFVLFIIAFVSVLDLVFGWALLKVFS